MLVLVQIQRVAKKMHRPSAVRFFLIRQAKVVWHIKSSLSGRWVHLPHATVQAIFVFCAAGALVEEAHKAHRERQRNLVVAHFSLLEKKTKSASVKRLLFAASLKPLAPMRSGWAWMRSKATFLTHNGCGLFFDDHRQCFTLQFPFGANDRLALRFCCSGAMRHMRGPLKSMSGRF